MTDQDKAAEQVADAQAHPTEEQQRAIDEAKAENARLAKAQAQEAEAAARARGEAGPQDATGPQGTTGATGATGPQATQTKDQPKTQPTSQDR